MNILFEYLMKKMSQYPDTVITDGVESITYEELLKYANQKYTKFTERKYGIICKNAINTIKAVFCCLCSNSTTVIMSNRYGESYCKKIVKKTRLSFLIDDDGVKEVAQRQHEIEDISDVAYIMCTSGTTGEPKAAMLTYKNILSNVKDISKYFEINKNDRILINRPLCHASALTGELFTSLVNGASIIISNTDYNPFEISNIIFNQNITTICSTPTVLYQIANVLERKKEKSRLRKIAVSGECMTKSVSDKLLSVFTNVEIFNVYGLTEASPRVSYLPSKLFSKKPESVGIALDSVRIKIIDQELFVSGESVMKGYYDDTELTDKVFRQGWLKTGDIASVDSEGLLYVKGRKDNLIIRSGMNIYPQEIENALMQNEQIINVMAYGIKHKISGQKIGIRVVSKDLSEKEIFNICKKMLPNYQLPDVIECVDVLPRNKCGKIIRN